MSKLFTAYFLVATVCVSLIISCSDEPKRLVNGEPELADSNTVYSFFVAGHAYGNPTTFQYGLHPPFKTLIPEINKYPHLELGVFTGDVVPKPTDAYWDAAEHDIGHLKVPTHVALGNHDMSHEVGDRFVDHYAFQKHNDLFIIWSPRAWNIDTVQMNMLKREIETRKNSIDNLFIFCHELIWWSPENEYKNVEINYRPHYPGSTNYWEEVHPYLDSLEMPVYLFAGDIGASDGVSPYMYDKKDNVSLFASGMGSNMNDNVLFVNVSDDGTVKINMIGVKDHQFGLIRKF